VKIHSDNYAVRAPG